MILEQQQINIMIAGVNTDEILTGHCPTQALQDDMQHGAKAAY